MMDDLGDFLPTAAPSQDRQVLVPPSHLREIGYCPALEDRSPWGRMSAPRHLGLPEWHRAHNQQVEEMLGQKPDALPDQKRFPQRFSMFE